MKMFFLTNTMLISFLFSAQDPRLSDFLAQNPEISVRSLQSEQFVHSCSEMTTTQLRSKVENLINRAESQKMLEEVFRSEHFSKLEKNRDQAESTKTKLYSFDEKLKNFAIDKMNCHKRLHELMTVYQNHSDLQSNENDNLTLRNHEMEMSIKDFENELKDLDKLIAALKRDNLSKTEFEKQIMDIADLDLRFDKLFSTSLTALRSKNKDFTTAVSNLEKKRVEVIHCLELKKEEEIRREKEDAELNEKIKDLKSKNKILHQTISTLKRNVNLLKKEQEAAEKKTLDTLKPNQEKILQLQKIGILAEEFKHFQEKQISMRNRIENLLRELSINELKKGQDLNINFDKAKKELEELEIHLIDLQKKLKHSIISP